MLLLKTFLSNRRPFAAPFLPLLGGVFLIGALLSGCQVADEAKGTFDFATGGVYRPIIQREEGFLPKRVLVLPVTGAIDPEYRSTIERELLQSLALPSYWTVVDYRVTQGNAPRQQVVDRFAAFRQAQAVQADAVLFVNVVKHDPYNPIRLVIETIMERADTQRPVLNATFDYDTRDNRVADSARRYYQRHMPRTFGAYDAPNKSLYILSDNAGFAQFTGAHTGRILAEPFEPPKPKRGSQ